MTDGEIRYTKGLILKLENVGIIGLVDGHKDDAYVPASSDYKDAIVTRELLSSIFAKFGYVKHAEFRMGYDWATIRYSEKDPDSAKKAIAEYATNPLILGYYEVKLTLIEGEEERKIWSTIINGRDGRGRERSRNRDSYSGGRRYDDYRDRRDDYRRDRYEDDYYRGRRDDDYYRDRRDDYRRDDRYRRDYDDDRYRERYPPRDEPRRDYPDDRRPDRDYPPRDDPRKADDRAYDHKNDKEQDW